MQSFGRSLLYKARPILPILFIAFLSLVLARGLSSACSVISPAIYGATCSFGQRQPDFLAVNILYDASSRLVNLTYYLRGVSSQHDAAPLSFNSNMSHRIHMHPSMRLWKAATSA
jgi:hypothetical protein